MKSFFLSAAFMLALSTVSSAALVQVFCGSANSLNGSAAGGGASGNGGYGSSTINCASFAIGAGSTLNNVLIDVRFSYDGNETGISTNAVVGVTPVPPSFGTNNAILAISAVTGSANYNIINVPSRSGNNGGALLSGNPGVTGANVNAFVSNIAFSLSSIAQGAGNDFRGGTTVALFATYDYTLAQSAIPEPTSVALIGVGLVALATAARRRRS